MSTAAALALGAAALLAWPPARWRLRARVRALARAPAPATAAVPDEPGPRRRWAFAAAAGAAALLLVGGTAGVVSGLVVAVGVERALRRAGDDGERRARAALEDELPVACDLLAVCLTAGLPVGGALAAVAAALPGPLGGELAAVAGRYRLGSPARAAWAGVPAPVAALGRVVARAGESGSTVVAALRALAVDGRAALRARAEVRVRRAGVWVLAPLGACFLPAFVCLGVAPVVLGIAADVLP
ncbi:MULTISPECIES: type II secretion system F family protein [unclassified Blastococcus]